MKKFIPQTFNDFLALVLIFGIVALWVLVGKGILNLQGDVIGALIVTWTLIVQFYFRKKETEG